MFQNYMRRLFWLILGVAVSSIGIAMMLQANVGLEPWSVLQQGMSLRTGMTYGTASAIARQPSSRPCSSVRASASARSSTLRAARS